MPIYTKKGDKGETGLPGGRRLSKTDAIFEALGKLDQANAALGLAVSLTDNRKFCELITGLQTDLLALGAYIAADPANRPNFGAEIKVAQMENQIDQWDSELPVLQNFILPGGHPTSSALHLARTSIREAERAFHRLKNQDNLTAIYLNRLSDYVFQFCRIVNFETKTKERIWIEK